MFDLTMCKYTLEQKPCNCQSLIETETLFETNGIIVKNLTCSECGANKVLTNKKLFKVNT